MPGVRVAPEELADLEFEPVCAVGHPPESTRPPCEQAAGFVLFRACCPPLLCCADHLAEALDIYRSNSRVRCPVTNQVWRSVDIYLGWRKL